MQIKSLTYQRYYCIGLYCLHLMVKRKYVKHLRGQMRWNL